jgi:hypothetical protein
MKAVHFFETQRRVTSQNNGIRNYTAANTSKREGYCGFSLSLRANAGMVYQSGHDGLFPNLIQICKGRSEIIWTHFICSNCINFRLNTIELLAQYIPLLVTYIAAISLSRWELLDSFT